MKTNTTANPLPTINKEYVKANILEGMETMIWNPETQQFEEVEG